MSDSKPKDPEYQKELQEQMQEMMKAFDEFHATVVALKKQQQTVAKHIRLQIDQKKIDQIHGFLQSM
jgi:vacuolar-type H+-ATPase subunit E/Vma4